VRNTHTHANGSQPMDGGLKVAEKANQNNERNRYAEEKQQNGTHGMSPYTPQILNNHDAIALLPADRGRIASAKGADQKS
jgi:hypothetical protein